MKIRFNLSGAERKGLVTAVSEIVGCEAVYMKAPTFAYSVGDSYGIDKNGTLVIADWMDTESARELLTELAERGFVSEDTFDAEEPEAIAPAGDTSAESTLSEETHSEAAPVSEAPTTKVPEKEEPDRLVIEMPLDGFTGSALDNLEKLVASKAALIRKSIGAEALPIERESDRLRFPWFVAGASSEEIGAYTQLIYALCEMAKKQRRVTAKEKPADSEKFAFRCFLLRLGFIGDEYAAARKILLRNLSGDSSFKSGKRKDQAKDEAAPVAANTADSGAETGGDANADEGGSGADSAEKSGEERFYA